MKSNQENRPVSEKITGQLIIFKCNGYNRPLCVGYIAYEYAFDSIEHDAIFKALKAIGINETFISITEDVYTGATARVHIDNQVSEKIPTLHKFYTSLKCPARTERNRYRWRKTVCRALNSPMMWS